VLWSPLPISKICILLLALALSCRCTRNSLPTDLFTETTQIWGKEFPGGMFSMKPGNSSFFSFSRLTTKIGSAHLPNQPSPTSIDASEPSGAGSPLLMRVPAAVQVRRKSQDLSRCAQAGLRMPGAAGAFRRQCCTLFQDGPRHRDAPLFVQYSAIRAGQGSGVERIRI